MIASIHKSHNRLSYRIFSAFIAFTFIFSLVLPPSYAQLIPQTLLNLPAPGTMVVPTTAFTPALINGITIHPENPLEFDFIVGTGDDKLQGKAFEDESTKLIKYFLASLTVPEDEMWVNLSPYEKDRIVPQGFGTTEMGRDLLAQDYILKQLTASLMYPEKELGKKFWDKIYRKAREQYGTTEIPVNTFNKVWIVPEKAVVYEHGTSAYVVKSRLKVMLEEDYLAMGQGIGDRGQGLGEKLNPNPQTPNPQVSTEIIREIILPEIEKEVNEGKSFANLRQIYNSAILAAWFKQNLRQTLLGQVYVDKAKTKGVDVDDKTVNEKIYAQYLEAFRKGVYNYIKEDVDPATQEMIPRKYFSGGVSLTILPSLNLKTEDVLETYKKDQPLSDLRRQILKAYLAGQSSEQQEVDINLLELSQKTSVADAQRFIDESQQHISTSAEVEKVKEDVLARIKEARRLLEGFSAKVEEGIVPSGVNVQKFTRLLNALKEVSLKDTDEKKKRREERVPAASLFNIIEGKNLGFRIQRMLETLNGNTNTSKEDKQEITRALSSLQASLQKFKSFESIIFQEANLDEQLKKVSHALNLPEVNVFYALRNAVDNEKLADGLAGILGVTPGDELRKRMTAADMIYRAGDTYILRPYFLTSPKLKKITSGISKGLVGTVEKAIMDSVDVNNFVAGLAWDSRKSEEEIVRFLEGQKRLSPLAERWQAFHAQESGPDALRETAEGAKGIAGEFIKSHPTQDGEFVLAVRVAPDGKSAVVTTAIQSPSGNNERASRILLLDLSKGDAGVKVLDEASKAQYNSSFNQIAFFDEGTAVTVWGFSRQRKWDIRDPQNPRAIGWQEEETWAQETSSSSLDKFGTSSPSQGQGSSPVAARVEEIKGLLQEIEKERQAPGSGNLPQVAVISDVHGAAELFFKYTADAISQNIGRPVILEDKKFPKLSIKEQLEAQGIDIREITLKFNLLGDWEDRGPYGVKVHLAGIELDELGLVLDAGMVQGNHDEWMGNNLKGLHLPLRKGHNYRGNEEIRRLVEDVHWNDPEIAKDRFGWWAAKLKAYNVSQKDLQENGTLAIDGEQIKIPDIRKKIKDEIYPTLKERADVTAEQKKLVEDLMGVYHDTDVFTGFNDIGMMPVEWWQERYERVREYAQAVRKTEKGYEIDIGTELKRHVWEELEKYSQEAARIVRERFDQAIQDGKWEWAFFNDQNKWNYESPEWWAKDWLYHSNWGESVLKELNELEEGGIVWDETNYMNNPYLQKIASYKQTRYNLFQRDPYGFPSTHGWLPVDRKTAKMGFSYKGIKYEGDNVWEGLEAIERDRSNPALSLEEVYEGIELVNSWYADKTTEIKPEHIAYNVNTLGLETIFKANGIGHVWFTGHNPQNKLVDEGLAGFKSQQGEYALITTDKGMSYKKYNDLGGYVLIDAKGIRMRGFSGTDFGEVIDNPATFKLKKDGKGGYVIGKKWENEAIGREDFLNIAEKQLKEELTRLQSASSPVAVGKLWQKLENRVWGKSASEKEMELDAQLADGIRKAYINNFDGLIEQAQQKAREGMRSRDGEPFWGDGLEEGFRVYFDSPTKTILIRGEKVLGRQFFITQDPDWVREESYQGRKLIGNGIAVLFIGYDRARRSLYVVVHDGADYHNELSHSAGGTFHAISESEFTSRRAKGEIPNDLEEIVNLFPLRDQILQKIASSPVEEAVSRLIKTLKPLNGQLQQELAQLDMEFSPMRLNRIDVLVNQITSALRNFRPHGGKDEMVITVIQDVFENQTQGIISGLGWLEKKKERDDLSNFMGDFEDYLEQFRGLELIVELGELKNIEHYHAFGHFVNLDKLPPMKVLADKLGLDVDAVRQAKLRSHANVFPGLGEIEYFIRILNDQSDREPSEVGKAVLKSDVYPMGGVALTDAFFSDVLNRLEISINRQEAIDILKAAVTYAKSESRVNEYKLRVLPKLKRLKGVLQARFDAELINEAQSSSPVEIHEYAALAEIAKKYSLEGLENDNFVFVYKNHAGFLEELIKKGYGEVNIWNVRKEGYYPNVNESTPNELLEQRVLRYWPGMIIISKNRSFNKYDLPTTKEIVYQMASQVGEVDKKTGEVEFHSEDVIAKIARLLSANGFGDELIRDEHGKEIAPTKEIDPFFDDEYQSDEYIKRHTAYRKYTIDRYDPWGGRYGASGIILVFQKDGSIRQYYKISGGAQPDETKFASVSSPVVIDKLIALKDLNLQYGLQGGKLSNKNEPIYLALNEFFVDVAEEEKIANTLARMAEGDLTILNILGILTDKEKDILSAKDAVALQSLSAQEKKVFRDRIKAVVDSYKPSLTDIQQNKMLKRLIPMNMVNLLSEYFGISRAYTIYIVGGHPDYPLWMSDAYQKVGKIQDRVGGKANAWHIIIAQGIEKTDDWVLRAESKVAEIEGRVGGKKNAWQIVIGQGIEKTNDWVSRAERKVAEIKGRVGGTTNAWQIVTRQGIEKTDDWVLRAESKVVEIKDRVGGEPNTWFIVIAQGIEGVERWIAQTTPKVEALARDSGISEKRAWNKVIYNAGASPASSPVETRDLYRDFYDSFGAKNKTSRTITREDVSAFSLAFLSPDAQILPYESRRSNGTFGVTEVNFLEDSATRHRMAAFQQQLKTMFGDKVYLVAPDKLHFTIQGLETQWADKAAGTKKELAMHAGLETIDMERGVIKEVRERARNIVTPSFKMQVAGLNWNPQTGIFWELRPYLAGSQEDPVMQRRKMWELPQPRPPHVTAAYFTQEFNPEDMTKLRQLVAQYQNSDYFGDIAVNNVEVIAYTDFSFNAGYKMLENVPLTASSPVKDFSQEEFGMESAVELLVIARDKARRAPVRDKETLDTLWYAIGRLEKGDKFYFKGRDMLGILTTVAAKRFLREAYDEKYGTSSSPVTETVASHQSPVTRVGSASDEIPATKKEVGGIDLNPALLDLQIKRDGNGIPLPLPQQPIEDMHIEGFLPIIINITPVTNLPMLLGLADTATETQTTTTTPDLKASQRPEVPFREEPVGREVEPVSLLN